MIFRILSDPRRYAEVSGGFLLCPGEARALSSNENPLGARPPHLPAKY